MVLIFDDAHYRITQSYPVHDGGNTNYSTKNKDPPHNALCYNELLQPFKFWSCRHWSYPSWSCWWWSLSAGVVGVGALRLGAVDGGAKAAGVVLLFSVFELLV